MTQLSFVNERNKYELATKDVLEKVHPSLNPAIGLLDSILNKGSKRTTAVYLNKFAKILRAKDHTELNWAAVDFTMIDKAFSDMFDDNVPPSTMNGCLTAIKSVMRYGWKMEVVSMESYLKVKDVKSIRGNRLGKQRYISDEEEMKMFALFNDPNNLSHIRNKAFLAVALGCALRREELSSLELNQFKTDRGLNTDFTVVGKGNKERDCCIPNWVVPHLEKWIEVRGDEKTHKMITVLDEVDGVMEEVKEKIPDGNALFVGVNRHGKSTNKRLGSNGIYDLVRRITKQAKIKPFAPHSLRGTSATNMFMANWDVMQIKKALGHESLATTERYDLRGTEQLKDNWKNIR